MIEVILGIFYGLLTGLNSDNMVFFVLKYSVLLFLSYVSVLYFIKKITIGISKQEKKYIYFLSLFFIILLIPIVVNNILGVEQTYNSTPYLRIFLYFPLFFFVLTRKKIDLRNYLIFFSYLFNLIAVIQVMFGQAGRTASLMTHPNFYAVFCIIVIIFTIEKIIFFSYKKQIQKKWDVIYVFFNVFIVFYGAGARTSFFALILVLIATFLLFQKTPVKKIFFIFSAVFLGCLLLIITNQFLLESRIFNIDYGIAAGNLNSFEWRVERWESVLKSWYNKDVIIQIFGMGWEASKTIDYYSTVNYLRGYHVHSEYIRILIEFGVLGLFTFTASIIKVLFFSAKKIYREGYFSLFAISLFIIIASFTENLFVASETFSVILLSICICFSIIYRGKEN